MGYILFDSEDMLYIQADQYWDGLIEYSYNNTEWTEWNGETIVNNRIYMRGINNTFISSGNPWIINGANIKCHGNIENLLDYKSVINNIHPKMDKWCFGCMFENCKELIESPQLLSDNLTEGCYGRMFYGCIKLQVISPLLNVNLPCACYSQMFSGCTSLSVSPCFPNFTIAKKAIINYPMFEDCSIQNVNINNKLYDINVLKLF